MTIDKSLKMEYNISIVIKNDNNELNKKEILKMKEYRLSTDYNEYIINHRNARKAIRDYGCDHVTIRTIDGKFVCRGTRYADGTITVSTIEY